MATARDRIVAVLDTYLKVTQFKDYAPIGLQVEGAAKVQKVVTGVSFNMALLEAAVAANAQMVLVHHGTFWKGESAVLKGAHKERLRFLLEHDLTLLAYHLPLDAHPVVGNNAQLAKLAGARVQDGFGDYQGVNIGVVGAFERAQSIDNIRQRLRPIAPDTPNGPTYFPGRSGRVRRFGVVSGGAGSMFGQAVEAGLDLYITGEAWEPAQALARETGVGFLALGHHNSEKLGVQALGRWLQKRLSVSAVFVDVPNPA